MVRIQKEYGFLNTLLGANIVFLAYRKMGYYSWRKAAGAIGSYYKEKERLKGEVLAAKIGGITVGTLMCSVDNGWLPTDDIFPAEMQEVRRLGVRIGYFGKLGVVPWLQGKHTGLALVTAATKWSIDQRIGKVLIIINPSHVRFYRRFGFTEIARSDESAPGLEKAPAVMMELVGEKLPAMLRMLSGAIDRSVVSAETVLV